MAINTLEICAGVGMLGEGLRAGLARMGIDTRVGCYLEREAYPAAVLAARMQDGSLDAAPVWSDILTFDAAAWAGAVDCVVAGFPCQDLSLAGRRAGLDGKRSGLFFDILDIAHACGARYLFLENVAGIASATASVVDEAEGALDERAAARVLGELADRGWNAEWLTLSASDVGASHGRERWFCWAWRELGHADHERAHRSRTGAKQDRSAKPANSDRSMGNTGLQYQHLQQREDGAEYPGTGGLMECEFCGYTFPKSCGRYGNRGGAQTHGPVSQLCGVHAIGLFAPGPTDPRWAGILDRAPWLAPAIDKTAESGLRGVADGLADRSHDCRAQRLKCVGNGVVALQAAAAAVVLVRRMMEAA